MRLLVVTAVAAESDSAATGLRGALAAQAGPGEPTARALPGGRTALRVEGLVARTASGRSGALEDSPHTTPPGSRTALRADVLAAGAGPAAAAAGTAAALAAAELAGDPYDLVVSAGIGGGFWPAAPVGSIVVAAAIVAADLGAEAPGGADHDGMPPAATSFVPVVELGFGTSSHCPPAALSGAVARALGAAYGPVLTVSTVTGTADRATELAKRHPGAVAEAMEGFGVAEAAAAHGVPALEIRTVSNPVGPRDRAAWRIGEALAALAEAFGKLPALLDIGDDS